MTTNQLIAKIQALPKTHAVITVWSNGKTTRVEAVSVSAAENNAVRMRRALGGEAVSVEVVAI